MVQQQMTHVFNTHSDFQVTAYQSWFRSLDPSLYICLHTQGSRLQPFFENVQICVGIFNVLTEVDLTT